MTPLSRREFLTRSSLGFGTLALADLLRRDARGAAADPLGQKSPHFAAKAKHVIFLFMQGGASHLDTFDPKPTLKKLDGQPLPASFNSRGLDLQFMKATGGKLMASPFSFRKCGQSGLEISEIFPHLARHADDLAVVRSCWHDSFIHGPAISLITPGSIPLGH